MEMNSDMSEFMNMDAIDEVKPEALSGLLDTVMEECGIKDRVDMLEQDRLMKGQTNLEQTQSLIDEVEEYLKVIIVLPWFIFSWISYIFLLVSYAFSYAFHIHLVTLLLSQSFILLKSLLDVHVS